MPLLGMLKMSSFATSSAVGLGFVLLLARPATAVCPGDCDGNLRVTVDELVIGVNILLGTIGMERCAALDVDAAGGVEIDELMRAVNVALTNCPAQPSPTPTPTPAPGNRSPSLAAIGDRRVILGASLTFELQASDPDGDPLEFAVLPLPLPPNATFHAPSGLFTFRPAAGQVGELALTFSVSDGELRDTETVRITVEAPAPGSATRVIGRILDTNDFVLGLSTPVVGATVTVLGSGVNATSDEAGRFELTGVPGGGQVLDIDTRTATSAPDGSPYAGFRERITLVPNAANVVDRPFFLPRIAHESLTRVDPDATTLVNNPSLGVSIVVPANTAQAEDGSDFAGELSISEVPGGLAPAALPANLEPALLITIQPVGVTFANPVAITFPNVDNLAPGSETDIWSLDPATGAFSIVGTGRVSADGQRIETIAGGVRAADWHLTLPPAPDGDGGPEGDGENQGGPKPCSESAGSQVTLHNGCLRTEVVLPIHYSLGRAWALRFVYQANRADPQPAVPIDAVFPARAALPAALSFDLTVGGTRLGLPVFVSTAGLEEGADESIRVAAAFDAADLPSGVYPYHLRLTSRYAQSAVSSGVNGEAIVVNRRDSFAGAGWGLSGLQRLLLQPDGRVLATDGDGSAQLFNPVPAGIFSVDEHVLALFEFDDGVRDSSGNGRDALLLGGGFVSTELGRALRVTRNDPMGFDWSAYASLLTHPFTVEIVLTPHDLTGWRKLFGPRDATDNGWYYFFESIQAYPHPRLGEGQVKADQLHYLAFVSTNAAGGMDVYFQGNLLGSTETSFTLPPEQAIFFRDDPNTRRSEQLTAEVESVRISSTGRTAEEIAAVQRAIELLTRGRGQTTAGTDFIGPRGDFTQLMRNGDGTFIRTYPNGAAHHYDARGLQTAHVDRNGNVLRFEYDERDRPVRLIGPAGQVTAFLYAGDHLRAVTDPAGRTTSFTYDTAGNLTGVILPDGSNRTFAYDKRHRLTRETDARGLETTRTYDALGRLVRVSFPDGSSRENHAAQLVGWVDPASGLGSEDHPAAARRSTEVVSSATDGEGRTITVRTGPLDTATEVRDAAGFTTRINRDGDGNPVEVEFPSRHTLVHTYDARGNLLSAMDSATGGMNRATYEPRFSRVTSLSNADGATAEISYDERGNPVQITSFGARRVSATFDARGLPLTVVDPLGTLTTFAYDARGNAISVISDPQGAVRVREAVYADDGRPLQVTDPEQRRFGFSYDAMGRLTELERPDGEIVRFGYDPNGNLTSVTPPGREAHRFTYTPTNLLASYLPPAGPGSPQAINYEYNAAQQVTRILHPGGESLSFVYDGAGRLEQVMSASASTHYTYDERSGNLIQVTAADGGTLTLDYQGQVMTAARWAGTVSGEVRRAIDPDHRAVAWEVNGVSRPVEYDADGLIVRSGELHVQREAGTGQERKLMLGAVVTTLGYNAFAELVESRTAVSGRDVFAATYSRDRLGRIVELHETVLGEARTVRYSYDAAGRLLQVDEDGAVTSYEYDANGNLTRETKGTATVFATYDGRDRLLDRGSSAYTFDDSGRLTRVVESGSSTTFEWDPLGNLLAVDREDLRIDYVLDGLQRRIGKRVDGTLRRAWLYQGRLTPVAELDAAGNVVSRFFYPTRPTVPDAMERDGHAYRIVSDHLGSPRLVVDAASGAVVQRMDYDAFGRVLTDTNPGFQPFGFAGGLYDPDTGLVQFGARQYDARSGRWISLDPLYFVGGTNRYQYAGGDPVNGTDPTGLQSEPETTTVETSEIEVLPSAPWNPPPTNPWNPPPPQPRPFDIVDWLFPPEPAPDPGPFPEGQPGLPPVQSPGFPFDLPNPFGPPPRCYIRPSGPAPPFSPDVDTGGLARNPYTGNTEPQNPYRPSAKGSLGVTVMWRF